MADIFSFLIEPFRYDFILRALLTGTVTAVCAALLGTFLVLKRYAMIGDGLAHVSFASMAFALLFGGQPLFFTLPIVTLSSLGILRLTEKIKIHGDSAIALISAFSAATGILIVSLARGFNADIYSFLFGSILTISRGDMIASLILGFAVIGLVWIFAPLLGAASFDEDYLKSKGFPVRILNYFLIGLTAAVISTGIRIAGTMLISSFLIFPAVTALQAGRSFRGTLLISAATAAACVFFGVLFSFYLNLPTGACIVYLNTFTLAGFLLWGHPPKN